MSVTVDQLLQRLEAGEQCSQPIRRTAAMPDVELWNAELCWQLADGTPVTNYTVSRLRRRGLVAVSEGAVFRYVMLIRETESLPLHGRR